jgi:hypothetical protein
MAAHRSLVAAGRQIAVATNSHAHRALEARDFPTRRYSTPWAFDVARIRSGSNPLVGVSRHDASQHRGHVDLLKKGDHLLRSVESTPVSRDRDVGVGGRSPANSRALSKGPRSRRSNHRGRR